MNCDYVKTTPITIRDAGKDEKWLHDVVCKDTSLIGLGDLLVIERERAQPTGGRIDLILSDPEESLRYEVEIMLGAVDESHIIRTIEYWDVERRRYPSYEHKAVIIAEEITNRFFNIIGLLNKAIPIIAIQLNAFLIDSKLCLNFVKVLDVMEEGEEEPIEQVDRKYWEGKVSAKSLAVLDKMISFIPKDIGEVRVKYNRGHVALGTTGKNFCWFHPRKGSHVHFHIKPGTEARDAFIKKFEDKGIECRPKRADLISMVLTMTELEDNKDLIVELILAADKSAKK